MTSSSKPMIEVVWHDAHSEGVSGGTWFDPAEIKNAPYQVRSVGYLLENVKDGHITLAQSVDRKSTRLNSSHSQQSRMPSSA